MSGFFNRAQWLKNHVKVTRFNNFSIENTRTKGTLTAMSSSNCDCIDGMVKNGVGIERASFDFGHADHVFVFDGCDGKPPVVGMIDGGGFYQYFNDSSRPIGFQNSNISAEKCNLCACLSKTKRQSF